MHNNLPALLIAGPAVVDNVYPEPLLKQLSERVQWILPPAEAVALKESEDLMDHLAPETEVIFSTWGMPRMDEAFLDALPNLKAVFYAAGSVRGFVTEESWRRGIRVFSAASANAVPVAEFTIAQILLCMKQVHRLKIRSHEEWRAVEPIKASMRGNYHSRIGLISYGAIAKLVRRLLRQFEHQVWVYDPFLFQEEAEAEDIHLCGLDELFQKCQVVSLHAPLLEETRGLVRGHHLESMPENAAFINTARGAIVRQEEMTEVLRKRTDLTAILDVLHPEPPEADEPLLKMPNVRVYPHIAGSMGHECERMGRYMLEACQHFLSGKPSPLEVREADLGRMA